ncbi:MAG TPA: hypothetical protein VF517_15005 [Thermoleophilaceae bacterium]|jgi:hypothetical protein
MRIESSERVVEASAEVSDAGDSTSQAVAETTAHLHFEGKGFDPELEGRYEDD